MSTSTSAGAQRDSGPYFLHIEGVSYSVHNACYTTDHRAAAEKIHLAESERPDPTTSRSWRMDGNGCVRERLSSWHRSRQSSKKR